MDLELSGKRVVVTGASRGIGRAIATTFAQEGCRVALNGRTHSALDAAMAEIPNSLKVAGDVTVADQAQRIVDEAKAALGGIDILVCNVGSGRSVPPGQESYDEWQRVFAVNLWSTTNMVEAARESLVVSRGSIVCVSSICGLETVPGAPVTYATAKAALHAYISGISRPLGLEGIRINAVAPGNVIFDGSSWAKKMTDDGKTVRNMLKKEVPLERFGTPEEIADLVAYLASAKAGFATGQVWALDGGQMRS